MADGLTEEKLNKLADALANEKNLPTLGLKLGFRRSKVEMYISSNKRNKSSEGTSLMLFDWKRKTLKARQIPDLVKALNDSDFVELVDEFFPGQDSEHHAVEGMFDDFGGELFVETYGFKLIIPPGALEKGMKTKIALDVLTELPDDINLGDDEMVFSYGFLCLPSGLRFKKPVRLIIPHCAILNDPGKVKAVLYLGSQLTKGKLERIPQHPETCFVKQNHFELSLQHFTKGYLTMIYEYLFVRGKSVLCMLHLQKNMPHSRKPLLKFHLQNNLQGPVTIKDDPNKCYRAAIDQEEEVLVKPDDLKVSCQLANDNSEIEETIRQHILFKTSHQTLYFELDLNDKHDETRVRLTLSQLDEQLHKILFDTKFTAKSQLQGQTESPSPSASNMDSTSSLDRIVTDKELMKLAGCLHSDYYMPVAINLGLEYTEYENIKRENASSLKDANFYMLRKWKNKQNCGKVKDLDKALNEADCGTLSYKENV